jgi:hypothetical protein
VAALVVGRQYAVGGGVWEAMRRRRTRDRITALLHPPGAPTGLRDIGAWPVLGQPDGPAVT